MSKLLEVEPIEPSLNVEGVEVVPLETEHSPVKAFESVTPLEVLHKEVEASELSQDGNVRASTQEFIQQKEAQAKLQQEENGKNWQWFQMARMESERGTYRSFVTIGGGKVEISSIIGRGNSLRESIHKSN